MILKRHIISLFLLFLLPLASQSASAATAYITDTFRISLRRGPTIENKILKFLPSGMPVETMESENGWTKITVNGSTEDSITGWVLTRYLIQRHPWKDQTVFYKESNKELVSELETLKKEVLESKNRNILADKEIGSLKTALEKTQSDYAVLKNDSSNYFKIKAAHMSALEQIESLKQSNTKLQESGRNLWMATGGIILLSGLLIGFVMGRQQKRNRQNSLLS